MKKIPTLFVRDPEDRKHVLRDATPGCEWVLAGEGIPTRKLDGTAVKIADDGTFWKRREVKKGKPAPADFVQEQFDPETGKFVGWVPVTDGPEDAIHREAQKASEPLKPGTYELIGPKINGNPEHWHSHALIAHNSDLLELGGAEYEWPPRDFDGLRDWLLARDFEGIVWHHADGRMCKLKKRDFS